MKLLVILTILISYMWRAEARAETKTIHVNSRNSVVFIGDIDSNSAQLLANTIIQMREALDFSEPLYLGILSPGGYIPSALRISTFLATIPNLVLICHKCDSAAGLIFATFHGKRLVEDRSELMIHEMYRDHVTAKDAQNSAWIKSMVEDSDAFNKAIRDVMGMNKRDYERKIEGSEWSVHGQEIVNLHLATELVKIEVDP